MGATLAQQKWRVIHFDEVVLTFLRAERHRVDAPAALFSDLLDHADLSDAVANRARHALLMRRRAPLFARLPNDLRWYRVQSLRDTHLGELRVFGRSGWEHAGDRNELERVARRHSAQLQHMPHEWQAPVLFAHDQHGPFTILEGNNRLVAYAQLSPRPLMAIDVIVGLSAQPCFWHLPDPF